MKKLIILALISFASSSSMARAFLESEEENGTVKYCKYSNDVIVTINYLKSCPLAIT